MNHQILGVFLWFAIIIVVVAVVTIERMRRAGKPKQVKGGKGYWTKQRDEDERC